MKLHGKTLKPGDVLMTNSPYAGGSYVLSSVLMRRFMLMSYCSHLPDITVISPVFDTQTNEIIFFTASRGHHADIGGILPGSMPPTSTNIFEEGANIVSFKIVSEGVFDRDGLIDYMIEKPSKYPGSSGCRNIRDVESDLKAVRARFSRSRFSLISDFSKLPPITKVYNSFRLVSLLHCYRAVSDQVQKHRLPVVDDYGLETVQEYMYHIRANAELSVRNLLRDVAKRAGTNVLTAVDYLDDGSPVRVYPFFSDYQLTYSVAVLCGAFLRACFAD